MGDPRAGHHQGLSLTEDGRLLLRKGPLVTRKFFPLSVAEIRPEIGGEATTVVLDVPPALTELFRWSPGQHLTLRFGLSGKEQRRCYTISNPPNEALRITVKRVSGGLVSNHIGDALRAGDTVEAMPPFGRFTLEPNATARRTHYFFGAGSGLTPLYAMIRAVLDHEPHSVAHLIYGNRSENEILFRETLDTLVEANPYRFTLRHVLSARSLLSWFSPWRTGRVDADAIKAAIDETPPIAQDVLYWICGPGSMNADVRAALNALDVPDARIHMESFGANPAQDTNQSGMAATARVTLDGETREVHIEAGQTILEAAIAAGLAPPFSCQSGVCGACRAIRTEGQVQMRAHMALDRNDIARGEVLTCQAVPKSKELAVQFPDT
nr:2Fe-2S iron-sulfur cluster-binding protein [Ruegeria arenilitoris]